MEPTYGYETRIDKPQAIKIPIKNIVSELLMFFNDFTDYSFDRFNLCYMPVYENKYIPNILSEYFPQESYSGIQENIRKILELDVIKSEYDKETNKNNFQINISSYSEMLKFLKNSSRSFKAYSSIVIKHSFNFLRYQKCNSKEHFGFDPKIYKYNTIEICIGYNTALDRMKSNIYLNMFIPVDLQEQSERNFLRSIEEKLKIKLSPYYFFQYLTDKYNNCITKKIKVVI